MTSKKAEASAGADGGGARKGDGSQGAGARKGEGSQGAGVRKGDGSQGGDSALLFLLPVAFFVATLAIWQWTVSNEHDRIQQLAGAEAARIGSELIGRLEGHAEVSVRSSSRWLLRRPRDQGEWDYDLFSRRWLHPELRTAEWLDTDLETLWAPSTQPAMLAEVVSEEHLQLAADEHRAIVTGPVMLPDGESVSLTIVPIERAREPTTWLVAAYDLPRMLGSSTRPAGPGFAVSVFDRGREIWTNRAGGDYASGEWVRSVDIEFDRFQLELRVETREELIDRFGTQVPAMALVGGLLATLVSALGIRLAQVSSRRAIEARMTEALQSEVVARKRAERALERKLRELSRSNEEFERFAYAVAHDLRDPLNAISLSVQGVLANDRGRLDEHDRGSLERGASAVTNLDALITRLLEYARAGSASRGPELVDANKALQTAQDHVAGLIAEHQATIRHDDLPGVLVSGDGLSRVFQNLLSNAIKYRAERKPEIEVSVERGDDEWVFAVADNARGMGKSEVARVFTLFWRRDRDSEASGSGIGLAVCKRIVERHGGRMWAESQPGVGSTFFFTWPADPEASGALDNR